VKHNRCVKKCKNGFHKLTDHICKQINMPRLSQFKFSSCILNWFGWILKLAAVNPKKEARPHNWISHVSSFNPWNRSATATSELSCHSCKILLIDLPNNFSRWQTRPSSHKYKLNFHTMNAEALKCFKNFVFCLHAYLFPRHFEANS